MKNRNKFYPNILIILLCTLIVVLTFYLRELRIDGDRKAKETKVEQRKVQEQTFCYDDSVVLEGKVIYIVYDEYDHPYLKQCVNQTVLYIPYTFTDPEEVQIDPTVPIYAKNQKHG